MSWRRGFFRVWVLLTITYLAIVAVVSYDGIISPRVPDRALFFSLTPEDYRDKYPGLSDAELEDAIYREYYSDMSREQFRARIERAKQGLPQTAERYDATYAKFEKGVAAGDIQQIEFEGLPGIHMFAPANMPDDKLEQRASQVYPMAVELRQQLVNEKRTGAIKWAAAVASIPPVIMLALGIAIAWVLAGFRRPAA